MCPGSYKHRRGKGSGGAPLLSLLLLLAVAASGCGDSTSDVPRDTPPENGPPEGGEGIVLTEVARLDLPIVATAPPGDDRLFVAQQSGEIYVLHDGEPAEEPFLDLSDRTRAQGERGLLGLAFHPEYTQNGRFFVNYTDLDGDTRVVEFRVSGDPDRADEGSASELLHIEQPFGNHNGGHLEFGPDGMLYVATGDGGGANDPQRNGQDVHTLLGGLLRLDVSEPGTVGIPADNPFAGQPGNGREELWAWGLRNPWRFSFDPETELLYIADVGQNAWEEVTVIPADQAGVNFGWPILEGPGCQGDEAECDRDDLVGPVVAYPNPGGLAVIGGFVARGGHLPGLDGHYLYSDLQARWIRSFRYEDGEAHEEREWEATAPDRVLSMGRDSAGRIYILTADGAVSRLDPAPNESP